MTKSRHTAKTFAVLAAIVLISATHARAQGCAQCLDATQATPPAVQAAYRHAIYLLAGVAATLFIAAAFVLRRLR
jgi:hypothetical protein